MPIHVYWGDDDFAIEKAVDSLRQNVVDPDWETFNYNVILDEPGSAIAAFNQVCTQPFGVGGRLVWLKDTGLLSNCPETILSELTRTLSNISGNSWFLLTPKSKPDERMKATKYVKKIAEKYQEFALIPPWKTDLIIQSVGDAAQNIGLDLSPDLIEFIAEAIGNDTRRLYSELEKINLYGELSFNAIAQLIPNTNRNSLQLSTAIKSGDTAKALEILADLILAAEPGLKIVATLISQFRTWALVKCAIASGERDNNTIARMAEIANPKRVYFLQQEVKWVSAKQLTSCLSLLLDLEVGLKRGLPEASTLQTAIIQMCQEVQKRL